MNHSHTFRRRLKETPYEVAIAVLGVVYGIAAAITGPTSTPNSLDDSLPLFVVIGWSLALAAGSGAVLAGRIWEWIQIESAGLAIQTGALLTYMFSVLSLVPKLGGSVLFSALSYLTLASATAIRLYVVRQVIKTQRGAANGGVG